MKLEIVKFNDGSLIKINESKPEYGSIQVRSIVVTANEGFLNTETRIGFIAGKVEDLTKLNLVAGQDFSKVTGIDMKIIYEETTTPGQNEGWRELKNPETSMNITTPDGEIVFRRVKVVSENSGIQDSKLPHLRQVVVTNKIDERTVADAFAG